MPSVGYVEKTIYNLEEVNVNFFQGGKNIRSEAQLPHNYQAERKTRNSSNVQHFKDRLKNQFPGYDFEVYDGQENSVHGNTLMGTLRDTYE